MKKESIIKKDYKYWISNISSVFKRSQIKAATFVNSTMLRFYFCLGHDICKRMKGNKQGSNFYKKLSQDLRKELPDVHSFSETNLKYMVYFYKLYTNKNIDRFEGDLLMLPQLGAKSKDSNHPQVGDELDDEILQQIAAKSNTKKLRQFGAKSDASNRQQLVDELNIPPFNIPWGHNIAIIDNCKGDKEKALFFVDQVIKNGWSRAVLLNFLDTDLYERKGKAISNFSNTLPPIQSDLAKEITKDPYNFSFLSLKSDYNEKELKEALLDNLQNFLLELGMGFAFVGKEYRLVVGETEQFIDLLFYNITNHCYIVVEIKTSEFEPSHMGQLVTYVTAVDELLKGKEDNQTIGLLICKSKDNILAQYAVNSINKPVGISKYKLSRKLPKDIINKLPSLEDIEERLK